ncbi:MAG TPA: protoporphyrinogen oxidase [Anaerolineae bacterium]|nr:protoporphyrinogen oxidase [Anaerolineae bacterium]
MTYVDVAIIGGGITGLSAAWYLQQAASPPTYALLEKSDRWGGKILTETIASHPDADPFIIEAGPDSFIRQKPWALQLATQLGLTPHLLPTNDDRRQTFVLHQGRPIPLPDGVMLMVPTKIKPFALSPLISPLGKLRMALDLILPAKKDTQDETVANFINRRLGQEALDKIAEPLLSGIYNADAQRQSLLATFPRFQQLEAKHGSLIKGMLAARQSHPPTTKQSSPPSKPSMFVSLHQGMSHLVTTLHAQLTGDCRLNTGVQQITSHPAHGYQLTLDDGTSLHAGTIILAVPAYIAARLVADIAPQVTPLLNQIRYVSTGTITLAYHRQDIPHPLNGFGIVIPRSEQRQINAITWSSVKFDHRAPQDYALLRVFFGGSRTPEMMTLDDDHLRQIVQQELHDIMGIQAPPHLHRIYRWPQATPQYDVGHLDRIDAIEDALPLGIFVTGSPYRGLGLPDCIHQAEQTAVLATTHLKQISPQTAPHPT